MPLNTLTSLFFLSFTLSACSGALASLELDDTPRDLLGGRYTAHLPGRAQTASRPVDTLVLPAGSTPATTLLTFGKDGERMLVLASETFALQGHDFHAGVDAILAQLSAQDDAQPERHTLGTDELPAVTLAVDPIPGAPEPHTLLLAFVAHPDQTLQLFSFQVNTPAAQHPEAARSLAFDILDTLALGDSPFTREPVTVPIATPIAGVELLVDLPADHVLIAATADGSQPGQSYVIRRMDPLRTPISRISFMFDASPSAPLHAQPHTRRGSVASQQGFLLGEPVWWKHWQARSGHLVLEIERDLDIPNQSLFLHVVITAYDPIILDQLRALLESLRFAESGIPSFEIGG